MIHLVWTKKKNVAYVDWQFTLQNPKGRRGLLHMNEPFIHPMQMPSMSL